MLFGMDIRTVHLRHLDHSGRLRGLVEADPGRFVWRCTAGPEHDQTDRHRGRERDQYGRDDLAQMSGDGRGRTMAMPVGVRGGVMVGLMSGHRPIIARTAGAHCSPRHIGRYRGGTFAIAGARSTGLRGR
ncbi:hypothetical protein Stube_32220 [Streptomyces tubercidicus]|uniref:Uncharacterized protein n=1 Tax=Streptomyces tubercidicus TaxID=47759 RepID=A0A640US11_9ACTN|nr:hypothetical protein Stube_32220 [Streptomyces tubercidicus]